MTNKSIRWKQRFQNFEKAISQLDSAVEKMEFLSDLEKEGLVQRFEYSFELAWKTLKDYLESRNVEAKFPRDVIKSGFQYELISDGEIWLEMLEMRNIIAHTYDEQILKTSVSKIAFHYYPELKKLYTFFKSQSE
jgi:nucleotidyltransferase substrate binding protein (TIGR01987 family)